MGLRLLKQKKYGWQHNNLPGKRFIINYYTIKFEHKILNQI